MKKRKYFVSNSSSASFCIPKKYLSDEQLDKLRKVNDNIGDYWDIFENEKFLFGATTMDNGDLADYVSQFFEEIHCFIKQD